MNSGPRGGLEMRILFFVFGVFSLGGAAELVSLTS